MTTKILVGSKNPVKIESVKEAFSNFFEDIEVIGIKVDSKVSDQPINEETFDGAKNRALELKKINEEQNLGAKFFVGIEGGLIKTYSKWLSCGGMCVVDAEGRMGFGTSPHFELPEKVIKKLLEGVELGLVMDEIMGEENVKQKGGAIGFFTKNVMRRKDLYVPGLIVALVPLLNKELFFKD